MNLIDLDKVRWTEGFYDMHTGEQYASMILNTEEWLEWATANAKVKAIPVEWIKKWLENIKNDKRYKSEYVELTQDVKRVEYKGTIIIRLPCISDMLDDWEKENERV